MIFVYVNTSHVGAGGACHYHTDRRVALKVYGQHGPGGGGEHYLVPDECSRAAALAVCCVRHCRATGGVAVRRRDLRDVSEDGIRRDRGNVAERDLEDVGVELMFLETYVSYKGVETS